MFLAQIPGPSSPLLSGLHNWLSPADDARPVDLLFVLAGRMSRKHYALQLFREGLAPKLLFSVARFEIRRFSKIALPVPLDLLKLAQDVPPPERHFFVLFQGSEFRVEHVPPRRFGTLTEIASLARWLNANPQIHSVALISAATHLRRIQMCCRSLLPHGVDVALLAVPDSFSDSADQRSSAVQSTGSGLLEFIKVSVYWVLLRLLPRFSIAGLKTRDSTTQTRARQSAPRSRTPLRLVLLGVAFLFGGEAFCLLGPTRYEPIVHFSCHAVFFAGVASVCLGAIIHWATKPGP
jgi:hypothetical protein